MTKKITTFLFSLLVSISTIQAQTATQPVGDGSAGNPYQIATLDNLYWVTQNTSSWDKNFIQTTDINASSTKSWDGGAGFLPIGNYGTKFTGTYNGKGHTIDSLFSNRATNYVAMFGYTTFSTIDSLGITNADITGKSYVGCLVGHNYNYATVSKCYSSGKVTSTETYFTGGLIGRNVYHSIIDSSYSSANIEGMYNYSGGLCGVNESYSTISNCYSTGNVNGISRVGGLLGANWNNCDVINSYSTSTVSGTDYDIGGFVGYNLKSHIYNSYCISGTVTGDDKVGGFIGYNNSSSSITNCYSVASTVSGNTYIGGFSGYNQNSTIDSSFWNKETTGLDTSAGGIGKTSAEMHSLCTYINGNEAAWDFVIETTNGTNNYWGMNSNENNGYPYLKWQGYSHTESCCGYIDVTKPVASITDQTLYADANCQANLIDYTSIVTASDNCDTSLDISQTPIAGTIISGDTNIVTLTITDDSSNFVIVSFSVIIEDTLVPETPTLDTLRDECSITATPPTTTDICAGTVTGTTTDTLTYSTQGTYTITWTFNDKNGNSIDVPQIIIIEDTTKPTISCIDNQIRQLSATDTAYTVSGTEFDPTSNDNCEIASITNDFNNSVTLADAKFPVGTTTVIWTVTDVANNEIQCSFDVQVNSFVGIKSPQQEDISIFPNPTTGIINFDFSNNNIQSLTISDITGKTIIKKSNIQQNETVDLSNFTNGIYIIKIQSNDKILTSKIIKK